MKKVPRFHVISTGRQSTKELVHTISAIHPYVDVIHLREKAKTAAELVHIIEELKHYQVPLSKIVINDRADVAHAMKVRGVHLAYHSLSPDQVKKSFSSLLVGRSVHSVEEARLAEKQGADYVFYGHVYPSQSKKGQPPRGIFSLEEVVKSVSIPVIAIGGIEHERISQIKQTGAYGIAVMSGIVLAENPAEEAKHYQNVLKKGEEYHA
ncbi:thiazole tautomerase (transcriptional regulator TenI) [Bacillus fengqiuensis]|nr:thiazole tautomerase (transcriptional regulator TenI) [Bacillus fengqiuensis]